MKITTNKRGNKVATFNSPIGIDNGYTNNYQGKFKSTMELFLDDNDEPTMIEWDVPDLETTEHIGIEYWDGEVQGYDGVFELPTQAILFLERVGFKVSEDLKDL